jgi:hypothetical protein
MALELMALSGPVIVLFYTAWCSRLRDGLSDSDNLRQETKNGLRGSGTASWTCFD